MPQAANVLGLVAAIGDPPVEAILLAAGFGNSIMLAHCGDAAIKLVLVLRAIKPTRSWLPP
jgi:hypothetical protein